MYVCHKANKHSIYLSIYKIKNTASAELCEFHCHVSCAPVQDVFRDVSMNLTGILVLPNLGQQTADRIVCGSCTKFVLQRRHIDGLQNFTSWCQRRMEPRAPLDSDIFVDVVTRFAGSELLGEAGFLRRFRSDLTKEIKSL